jgi:hypothetical protein
LAKNRGIKAGDCQITLIGGVDEAGREHDEKSAPRKVVYSAHSRSPASR